MDLRIYEGLALYEAGEMNDEMVDGLFQHLMETGMISFLQEQYQKTLVRLIESGRVVIPVEFK